MSTVIEIELDGEIREVTQLDITAHAFRSFPSSSLGNAY